MVICHCSHVEQGSENRVSQCVCLSSCYSEKTTSNADMLNAYVGTIGPQITLDIRSGSLVQVPKHKQNLCNPQKAVSVYDVAPFCCRAVDGAVRPVPSGAISHIFCLLLAGSSPALGDC